MNYQAVEDLKIATEIFQNTLKMIKKLNGLFLKAKKRVSNIIPIFKTEIKYTAKTKQQDIIQMLKQAIFIRLPYTPPSNDFILYFNDVVNELSARYEQSDFMILIRYAMISWNKMNFRNAQPYMQKAQNCDPNIFEMFKRKYQTIYSSLEQKRQSIRNKRYLRFKRYTQALRMKVTNNQQLHLNKEKTQKIYQEFIDQ